MIACVPSQFLHVFAFQSFAKLVLWQALRCLVSSDMAVPPGAGDGAKSGPPQLDLSVEPREGLVRLQQATAIAPASSGTL